MDLPDFDDWYEFNEEYYKRDMPPVYRQTMRSAKTGQHTEFVGTLCQIAALKSLMGDRLRPNLVIYPMICTEETREKYGCRECAFY